MDSREEVRHAAILAEHRHTVALTGARCVDCEKAELRRQFEARRPKKGARHREMPGGPVTQGGVRYAALSMPDGKGR